MKVVCISDTHGIIQRADLPDGDMLIHAGDLSLTGEPHEIQHALAWLRKQPHRFKFVIGGNHDNSLVEMPMLFDEQWKPYRDLTPLRYLCGSRAKINFEDKQWTVFGSSALPHNAAFRAGARAYMLDATTARHWGLAPDTDILITHGPPKGILDSFSPDSIDAAHFGDPCLRAYVDMVKPKLHVFGHAHIGRGTYKNEHTTFVNAAQLDDRYMPNNIEPIVVEV